MHGHRTSYTHLPADWYNGWHAIFIGSDYTAQQWYSHTQHRSGHTQYRRHSAQFRDHNSLYGCDPAGDNSAYTDCAAHDCGHTYCSSHNTSHSSACHSSGNASRADAGWQFL